MKKIFYFGYYDTVENKNENRNCAPAATNKMSYIIDVIDQLGYNVEVFSASQTLNRTRYRRKTVKLGEKSQLHLFSTLPWGNKIQQIFSRIYIRLQYRKFIINNIGKDDTLIVYHSVPYSKFITRMKKKCGFKLILEVEEIYADVNGREQDRAKEFTIFNAADSYIFPTELLNHKLNAHNKPYCVIHGTYNAETLLTHKTNDRKIHVVYAGNLDPRKGSLSAAQASRYLNGNYHIHIIGFGKECFKQQLLEEIKQLSASTSCVVTFDGLLSGTEYIQFIQSCHIGLCTQNPDEAYNSTSFPSKILSYMSNGLRVVSIRISAIENSKVGKHLYFYDNQTPESIASAILSVDLNDSYNGRELIASLSAEFCTELDVLLKKSFSRLN